MSSQNISDRDDFTWISELLDPAGPLFWLEPPNYERNRTPLETKNHDIMDTTVDPSSNHGPPHTTTDVSPKPEDSTSATKPQPSPHPPTKTNPNTTCTVPTCQKQFTTTSDTRRHEREVHHLHGGVSEYRCPHCPADSKRGLHGDKPFARKWNLQDHISRVHSGRKATLNDIVTSPSASSVKTESLEEETKVEGRRGAVGKKRKSSEVDSVASNINTAVSAMRLKQLEEENVGLKEQLRVLEEKLATSGAGPESRELEKLQLQLRLAEIEKADLRDKVKKLEKGL